MKKTDEKNVKKENLEKESKAMNVSEKSNIEQLKTESIFKENEEKEVERRLRYLSELEKYEEMEVVWNSMKPERKTEKTFLLMLEMFYNKKEKQSFFAILQELKQSELVLTAEGLNIIRYWNSISREKE